MNTLPFWYVSVGPSQERTSDDSWVNNALGIYKYIYPWSFQRCKRKKVALVKYVLAFRFLVQTETIGHQFSNILVLKLLWF